VLCPQCRRQVGKDGYCPSGHLARPELQEQIQRKAAQPPPAAFRPVPTPTEAVARPSDAPTDAPGGTVWKTGPITPTVPEPGIPPLYGEKPFGDSSGKGKKTAVVVVAIATALVLLGFFLLGSSAGASNLKVKFTPGETHTYQVDMTLVGRGGNLDGGFRTSVGVGAEMTQRTGPIDKDGSATLNYTLKNFHFSENGRQTAPPPGTGAAFSVRMRPDGTVIGLDGGDPFGLEDINPAGQFVNPSNAGPLLPKKKVVAGQSWTIEANQNLPDIGTVHATAVNTLIERKNIDGNDTAVIRSIVTVPLNIHFGRRELVRQAENDGKDASTIPGNASISMVGHMRLNFTQTIFTSNGLLQSALGDGYMRGTMTIGGVPGFNDGLPIAFDLDFRLTMQKLSTGQSA
jgi:hypothetical protein